ncbi:TRAP transporter substrate-binding protein [uncultured Marinococcus sp.]|uniref:TRAP transporter substrate-binding protein n=1 Tax=uncultured Marinococcus sp. TaxID=487012 RepID=UPI00260496BC|nr:TRAP transporter substrate-binding protein [uncultured Marinococcus sp.]
MKLLKILSFFLIFLIAGCAPLQKADLDQAQGLSLGGDDAEIVMRIGQSKASGHPVSKGIDRFAELVNEKSEGEIYIKTFHDAELGSDREVIESAQQGTLDLAASSTPNMVSFTELFQVWDLPYLFENKDEVYQAVDGKPGQQAKQELRENGFEVIFFPDYGFRQFVNNQKEVRVPGDMNGMRVRTTNSSIEMDDFRAWGANPTPIAWGETFTALQQGTIEAEGNSYSLLWDSNHQEVLDYATEINYNYSSDIVVMNKERFDNLSSEHQDVIMEAGQEAKTWQRNLANEREEEAKEKFKEFGIDIYEPTESEMDEWRKQSEEVWVKNVDQGNLDEEYLNSILDELGKTRKEIFE